MQNLSCENEFYLTQIILRRRLRKPFPGIQHSSDASTPIANLAAVLTERVGFACFFSVTALNDTTSIPVSFVRKFVHSVSTIISPLWKRCTRRSGILRINALISLEENLKGLLFNECFKICYSYFCMSGSLIYLQFILDRMIMRDANDLTCCAFFHILGDSSCFCLDTELMRQATDVVNGWELIGPDCDPVYSICRSANTVYTACRDAKIRKYILKQTEIPTS